MKEYKYIDLSWLPKKTAWYESRYQKLLEATDDYSHIESVLLRLHEFTTYIPEDGGLAYRYVKKIEWDLYDRGIIPFKITNLQDEHKISKVPDSDTQKILRCILTAMRYIKDRRRSF